MLEFSVCKMAYAMDAEGEVKQGKNVPGRLWRKLAYISGISVAAAVGAVLLIQNTFDARSEGAGAIAENRKASPFRKSTRNPTVKLPSLNSRGETSACLS